MKKLLVGSTALAAGLALLVPQTADACGGLFCDGGPNPMPVDQTGENVVFIPGANSLEVQIQVQYVGEAQDFAWVIPVLSIPEEFGVGSQQMFDNIMNASVPTYTFTGQADDCSFNGDEGGLPGDADGAGDSGAGSATGGGDTDGSPEEPTVVAKDIPVGAFEITVLEGGTAQTLVQWLDENGYQQDEEAEPIFEEYLATDHKFLAIKLSGRAGVDEIHPIALNFNHTEPCVPLKLTRIAAVDDMEVRVYFMAQKRTVPMNYKHVLINPLKIDWMNQATNYKEVIQRAVDADMANGRAWVTEYAGPSDIVLTNGLTYPSFDRNALASGDQIDAAKNLVNWGLIQCGWDPNTGQDSCVGTNPMVDPLVDQYVIPADVDRYDFLTNPDVYVDMIDPETYLGDEFADLLVERVIDPGKHAEQIINSTSYLSRMYTIISPHEMTEDPMFWPNGMLEDVPAFRSATQRRLCNGDNLWILPDGREVYIPADMTTWPDITGEDYWEEEVDETPENGAPMVLANYTQEINTMLAEYNKAAGWDGSQGNGGAEGGENEDEMDAASGEGCGCTTGNPWSGAAWAFAFLAGFGILARRRRQ